MSDFMVIKTAVQKQFDKMAKSGLWKTKVSKDDLWDTYLGSFRPEFNPIYKERTQHDCQCCRQFIRAAGAIVSIDSNNNPVSIWDIDIGGDYQIVADALSKLVKSYAIENKFLHYEKVIGTDSNHALDGDGSVITWEHFYQKLPVAYVKKNITIGPALSEYTANKEVFQRSMENISLDSAKLVLELIDQGSLYRGSEHRAAVNRFITHKKKYDKISENVFDNYCWSIAEKLGPSGRFKNTVIGTIMEDLSDGVDLEKAVKSFESKVAPDNYKRPTALITKTMIKKAQEKVVSLGLEESLSRRYAVSLDVSVNNVLFANRAKKAEEGIFDVLSNEVGVNIQSLKKVEEVSIAKFIKDILPKAEVIELLLENRHSGNLMSLIAPINEDSPNLFKWDNGFSWSYNGEIADSMMKERVKKAGGNVQGVLRFSIQWNDGDNNQNDFDAHCIEPNGNVIYYPKKGKIQPSSGMLDVDITNPGTKVAVENITWTDIAKIQPGKHKFLVHNYSQNEGTTGFTAEIEYNGQIYSYTYNKRLKQNEKVIVAEINFSRVNGIEFIKSLPSTQSSRQEWNLGTQQFHPVSMVMNSPNHWDGNETGNKHWFFILEGCKYDEDSRGFYNEFLKNDLQEHRKVFEVLGSKMKAPKSDEQLSGLGFSSTQRNSVYCKVSGSFNRTIKINF